MSGKLHPHPNPTSLMAAIHLGLLKLLSALTQTKKCLKIQHLNALANSYQQNRVTNRVWRRRRRRSWILLVLPSCSDAAVYISLTKGPQRVEMKIWMLLSKQSMVTIAPLKLWEPLPDFCVCVCMCIMDGLVSQAKYWLFKLDIVWTVMFISHMINNQIITIVICLRILPY